MIKNIVFKYIMLKLYYLHITFDFKLVFLVYNNVDWLVNWQCNGESGGHFEHPL